MNNKFPLVSVITPIYNGSTYLDDAIQSVISQTYQNWELILVDDGSQDNSFDIALNWQIKDKRIFLSQHPNGENKGVSASRNLAIQNSRGDYIALLDCDDEWQNDKLEKQVKIFLQFPNVGIIYTKVKIIDENGHTVQCNTHDINKYYLQGIVGNGEITHPCNIFEPMVSGKAWMPCSSVIMRKKEVVDCGLFNTKLIYQVEDHLLFTLVSEKTLSFFIDQPLCNYRLHSNSYTIVNKWRRSFIEYYTELCKYFPPSQYSLIESGLFHSWNGYIIFLSLDLVSITKTKENILEMFQVLLNMIMIPSFYLKTKALLFIIPINVFSTLVIKKIKSGFSKFLQKRISSF